MAGQQPDQSSQADQHNSSAIQDEHDIDQVLRGAETHGREPERNRGDSDDHQAYLPGIAQDTQAKPGC